MSTTTIISLVFFIAAGIFQLLYSKVALRLKKNTNLELKLNKFSSYSYSRKHLKLLKTESPNDEFLSKSVNKLLLYESLSIICFISTFLIFIIGNLIFGF
jgi:hypothetical protein